MIETWGLSCVLLRKIARLPAAWVNISLYVCVSVQSVQSILSRWLIWQFEHVRWWAHRNSHGSICWVRRPNQPSWGMLPVVITNMASSCLCNICSTLLISLACLHRKWRTKWLNPLRPHHRLLCCVCVSAYKLVLWTQTPPPFILSSSALLSVILKQWSASFVCTHWPENWCFSNCAEKPRTGTEPGRWLPWPVSLLYSLSWILSVFFGGEVKTKKH